ncbi:hypothetical protein OE88DRAFT_1663353 [Heliocybe sulcata]|uniref:Uncharacterized protein n=1 Tax=Heliocybe sulcata TaxID=5364 RepID=A0A5C3MU51_9AGAM|nr:hypothetical protein OE88DRAFT_1663353 [Heliocybe sulcata]
MSASQPRTLAMAAGAAAAGVGGMMLLSSGSSKSTDKGLDPTGKPIDANSTMQQGLGDVRQKAAAPTTEKTSHDA